MRHRDLKVGALVLWQGVIDPDCGPLGVVVEHDKAKGRIAVVWIQGNKKVDYSTWIATELELVSKG